jgi:hypothetical protein
MEPVYGSTAGIDVHKKVLAVVVRQERDGQVCYTKRKFGTTRSELEHVAAWLQHEQVGEVVMESTAQYWRQVWYGLEPHFRLHLTHPLKTRARGGASGISGTRSGWLLVGNGKLSNRGAVPLEFRGSLSPLRAKCIQEERGNEENVSTPDFLVGAGLGTSPTVVERRRACGDRRKQVHRGVHRRAEGRGSSHRGGAGRQLAEGQLLRVLGP